MAQDWSRKTYTQDELANIIAGSVSWREVARKTGKNPDVGSAYKRLKSDAAEIGADTSHFLGRAWRSSDSYVGTKRTLDDILVENSTYTNTTYLKKRLVAEGILEAKCSAPFCPIKRPVDPFTGDAAELRLALDHINGNNLDNRIENLRLLCYYCHGMTETFCRGQGKNK